MVESKGAETPEAYEKAFEVEFDGEKYKIEPAGEWSIDILEAVEDERFLTAVRLIVGEDQLKKFRKKHTKLRELNEFLVALTNAAGNS